MIRSAGAALILVLHLAASAHAGAAPPGARGTFARIWQEIAERLEEAAALRARVPPKPVEVTWGARKVGSLDAGAPVLAARTLDLDGDGRAEIVVLTSREVVVIDIGKDGGPTLVARAPLPPGPPSIRPRDPVGSLVVAGAEVLARSSEQAAGAAFAWRAGKLQKTRDLTGFPLCESGQVELEPGRNYFSAATATWDERPAGALAAEFYAARCRDLVDTEGAPNSLLGVVDTSGTLSVACVREGGVCPGGPSGPRSFSSVGFAFELADVDNDGRAEVITSGGQAPGDADRVTIYSLAGDEAHELFHRDFQGGVVALTAGDVDGDSALEVLAIVRLVGSTRFDLWTLD